MESNEISNEVKAVSAYLGCQVNENKSTFFDTLTGVDSIHKSLSCSNSDFKIDGAKLVLRTIDQLTDEECVELSTIISFTKITDITIKENIMMYLEDRARKSFSDSIIIYQYLLSIGIDLPSIYLDGKTLIEAGLAIRKE